MLRIVLTAVCGPNPTLRAVGMPWLLLAARIWLSQVIFVHQLMQMMGPGIVAPSGVAAGLHAVAPLLLAAGLLTRPVAVGLLAGAVWGVDAGFDASVIGPKAVLLVWIAMMGPGVLSLDYPLGRGLGVFPARAVRAVHRLYGLIAAWGGPVLQLAVRAGLAAAIVAPALPGLGWMRHFGLDWPHGATVLPAWAALLAGAALSLGCGTRVAALALAVMVPLTGITMSVDDRAALLLLLLIVVASGAGRFSIDALVARWAAAMAPGGLSGRDARPRVVVIGGGFGGIAAVQGLRDAPCQITLIDQRNYHLFQPLLYQVATAALSPGEIATPIRSLVRGQTNVRIHLGTVTGVDLAARVVQAGAAPIGFDYLVLATGARHSYFGRDEWAQVAPGLKTLDDATAMRSRLLHAFEAAEITEDDAERAAWLTFVIVGAGPTGIELAGALAELARHGMDQEFRSIDPASARVILVQSGPRVLPSFPEALSVRAYDSLRALGVDVRLGGRVNSVDALGVDIGGERIAARTVLWAAGVAASPAAQWLGQPADASGRVSVEGDLSVAGLPGVYAVGDTAACLGWEGRPVPGLAPAAKQQGHYVARTIAAALRGQPGLPPFAYRHFGSLATIGRQAAVAEFGRLHVWGAPAWWFWGAAHVTFLAGGRNRMTVVLNWIWAFLTYRRSTRLITGAAPQTP